MFSTSEFANNIQPFVTTAILRYGAETILFPCFEQNENEDFKGMTGLEYLLAAMHR